MFTKEDHDIAEALERDFERFFGENNEQEKDDG